MVDFVSFTKQLAAPLPAKPQCTITAASRWMGLQLMLAPLPSPLPS